jgi:hypothetical protein
MIIKLLATGTPKTAKEITENQLKNWTMHNLSNSFYFQLLGAFERYRVSLQVASTLCHNTL